MRYTLDKASGLPNRASILGLSCGTTSTAPSVAPRNTSSRILASRSSVAPARLRNSRLLRGAVRRPSDTAMKRVRMLQVAPTERPIATAVCSRLKPSSSGSSTAWAWRICSTVLAVRNSSRAA